MKFIPPTEIAGQIMTLFTDAKKEIIVVSPYINIQNWKSMQRCFTLAQQKKVKVTSYARLDAIQDLNHLHDLGIPVVLIEGLHAKIYLNESYAIVSSQNLYKYSADNSIDFAYRTESLQEYQELMNLVNTYLDKTFALNSLPVEAKTSPSLPILGENLALTETHVDLIANAFKERFSFVKINATATYVFCTKMFSFGDAMFREGYEIRFTPLRDYETLTKILDALSFKECHYTYKRKTTFKDYRPLSLLLIPQNPNDIEFLIKDYLAISESIIDATKNLKVNKLFMH